MPTRRVPQSRAERLIAIGRFALAIASFAAIYFDPLEPSRFPALTYSLLGAYAVYSLLTVVWTAAAAGISRRAQVTSHLLDLAFFGAINQLTFGPTSPFFTYFVFSIVCAMLRFGRLGTIRTAVAALAVYVASSVGHLQAVEFELNRFIIRTAYLIVVASMLIYLTAYQERIQRDLARVARWPRSTRKDHHELVSNLLSEASSIFGSRRALLAYEHLSERFVYLGASDGDTFEVTAEDRQAADLLLDHDSGTYVSSAALQAVPLDFDDSAATSRRRSSSEAGTERGLTPQLVERYDIGAVVATSFKGDFVRGRLLLLDGPLPLLEEVNLAKIAGGVIAGRLDHYHAGEQLQRGAVAEERVRVARDLHDSVLQSLTGVALQLRTLPRLLTQKPDEAQKRFTEIEQVIASAQKELRWFIDELRPNRRRSQTESGLNERLISLAQRFRDQWGIEVANDVAPVVHLLPISTRYEIYAIVNEGVANAAKHAAAKRVSVGIDVDDRDVRIDITDDGRGFPFEGRYDLRSLIETRRGPVTLKERVSSLGGSMIIDSSAAGAKLEIRVPLRAGAGE
ncbi:MAG: sensor histidine kinase [Thermoanaerobaculia bacterium]